MTGGTFTLRSNAGRMQLVFEVVDGYTIDGIASVVCNITLTNEAGWLARDEDIDTVEQFSLTGLECARSALEAMLDQIERWVRLPLEELAATPLAFEVDLTGAVIGFGFKMTFGPRADVIHGRKPVLHLAFGFESFGGTAILVTDVTSLTVFCEEARRALPV